jgi:putative membrane protein
MTMQPDSERRDRLALDRTLLANERTLLAYVRTALALLGAGVGLLEFVDAALAPFAGWSCLVAGALMGLLGLWRYLTVRAHVRNEESGLG